MLELVSGHWNNTWPGRIVGIEIQVAAENGGQDHPTLRCIKLNTCDVNRG